MSSDGLFSRLEVSGAGEDCGVSVLACMRRQLYSVFGLAGFEQEPSMKHPKTDYGSRDLNDEVGAFVFGDEN